MPPELIVNRFGGLSTTDDPDDGELTDLTHAENVFFERDGTVSNRPGIQFFARGPVCDPSKFGAGTRCKTYYCGELRKADGRVFQLFNAESNIDPNSGGQFFWNNTLATNETSTVSSGATTAGGINQLFDVAGIKKYGVCKVEGAQYLDNLILPSGLRLRFSKADNCLILETVSGFPTFLDGYGSMCIHKERVVAAPKFIVTATPNPIPVPQRVYFSESLTSSTWLADGFIEIGSGMDDGPITAVHSFGGRLVVLKTGGMWVVETPGATTSWTIRQYSEIGSVGRCSAVHDTGLIWVGQNGAVMWDGTTFTDIGAPIQDIFDENEIVDDLDSTGVIYREKFITTLKFSDGSHKNLIYDIRLNQWSEFYSPLEALGYQFVNFFTRDKRPRHTHTYNDTAPNQTFRTEDYGPPGFFFTMDTAGDRAMVYSMLDDTPGADRTFLAIGPPTTQIERPFTTILHSKYSDMDEPVDKKRIHRLSLEFEGPATTFLQEDEEMRSKEDLISGSGASYVKVGGIGFVRKLAFGFSCTYTGVQRLRIKRLFAKVSINGNQISNQSGQYE